MTAPLAAHYCEPGSDLQQPCEVAVVISTILRPTLARALASVFAQSVLGRVHTVIGIDKPLGERGPLEAVLEQRPPNHVVTVLDLGYSTSARHGGLHADGNGGALRTILSYSANSRHLAYLDDDNWWDKDHLATLLAAIKSVHWAFSLRWFVDPDSSRPICIDEWESVGPRAGIYQAQFGGFVDPNCLMIDKIACEPVLRLWAIPLNRRHGRWGLSADRQVFDMLRSTYSFAATGQPTAFYVMNANDPIHPHRLGRISQRLGRPASGY